MVSMKAQLVGKAATKNMLKIVAYKNPVELSLRSIC
jgi:hypothetical protein